MAVICFHLFANGLHQLGKASLRVIQISDAVSVVKLLRDVVIDISVAVSVVKHLRDVVIDISDAVSVFNLRRNVVIDISDAKVSSSSVIASRNEDQ